MSDNPSFDYIYNNTLRFLSYRPRSEKEVLDYLKKKEASSQNTLEIIRRLRDYNFINDENFARWYIENRKKGMRIISFELKRKGISKNIVEKVLEDFDLKKKEDSLLTKLVEKKWKTVSKAPKEKQYEKMMRFVLSKGFDYDDAKKEISKKTREASFDD